MRVILLYFVMDFKFVVKRCQFRLQYFSLNSDKYDSRTHLLPCIYIYVPLYIYIESWEYETSVIHVFAYWFKENFRNYYFWPQLLQTYTESVVKKKNTPDDAFRAGLRKLGPKIIILNYILSSEHFHAGSF